MQHYIALALSVIVLIAFFALYKPKRKDFSWDEKPEDMDAPDSPAPEGKAIIVPVEIKEDSKNSPFKAPELKRYRLDEDFELIIIAGVVYLVHDARYTVTMLKEPDGCPLSETRMNEKKGEPFKFS